MSVKTMEKQLEGALHFRLQDLEDCPVSSYAEFQQLHRRGSMRVGVRFDSDIVYQLGTPIEKVIHSIFIWSGLPAAVVVTILAMIYEQPFGLLGIPLALIAFFIPSPASTWEYGRQLMIVSAVCFVVSCMLAPALAIVIGGYLVPEFLIAVGQKQAKDHIHEAAMSSETLFTYLLSRRLLDLKKIRSDGDKPESETSDLTEAPS